MRQAKPEWLFASVVAWLMTGFFLTALASSVSDHKWWLAVVDVIALPAVIVRASKWWTRGAR